MSHSGEGSGLGNIIDTIGTIAPLAAISANCSWVTLDYPTLYFSTEVCCIFSMLGPNLPSTSLVFPSTPQGFSLTIPTHMKILYPLSPSGSQLPSAPPLHIDSNASLLKPSSTISAHMEHLNKRKPNDDNDNSMVSAACGSVVSGASGASTGSQKWHAAKHPSQDVSTLCEGQHATVHVPVLNPSE